MTGATRPDIPAAPVPSETATGPATASSEQLRAAISSAIEKAWWSPGTPASTKVMEIVGPLLERAEAAEATLAAIEALCHRCVERTRADYPDVGLPAVPVSAGSILAIIGTGEEPS